MSWYVPLAGPADEEEVIVCWETTVIFTVSSFQYLILATVFSKGRPFRKPFYTNRPFLASIIILTVFSIVLTVYPGTALATFFELMFDEKHLYLYFRLALLGMAVTNLIVCYTFEIVIGESRHLKTFCHILTQKKGPKNRFKVIQLEMDNENWPNCVLGSRTVLGVSWQSWPQLIFCTDLLNLSFPFITILLNLTGCMFETTLLLVTIAINLMKCSTFVVKF